MKNNGNAVVNKIYNPRNVKPPVPIDVDEADSAMERFIRQKYEHRILEDGKPKPPSRDDSGYHTYKSSEESSSPPPLPPKSGRKFPFGLRSTSSTSHLPRSSKSSNPSSPRSSTFGSLSTPIPVNKQSRVFGASIGETSSSFEAKLSALRDMGFPDDRRNATILKGLSGNLERTVESLIRLGEGTSPGSGARTPVPKTASSYFPSNPTSPNPETSTNPFDRLDSGVSTKPTQQQAPTAAPAKSYNPFDVPTPQPSSQQFLETSFQNLHVSQPLFPHSTGGYPSQQERLAQAAYQPLTPPVLPSSQGLFTGSPQPLNGNYNPFFQSPVPPQPSSGHSYSPQTRSLLPTNPFFGHTSPQIPAAASQQAQFSPSTSTSVFPGVSPQRQYTDPVPSFSASSFFSQPQQQYGSPQTSYNPFESMAAGTNPSITLQQPQAQPQSLFPPQSNVQPQYQQPQQTGQVDKNSILALYNISQAPSALSTMEQPYQIQQPSHQWHLATGPSPAPSLLTNSIGSTPQTQSPYSLSTPQRSVTMPEPVGSPSAGTRNPFLNSTTMPFNGQLAAPGSATAPSGLGIGLGGGPKTPQMDNNLASRTHMSQASVDIGGLQNGRHSPDAFASLSARYA
jgi:hypothetical protein